MDQWLLAVTSDPAAKVSVKDLVVAGAGPIHCHVFPFFPYHGTQTILIKNEQNLVFCAN